MHSTTPELFELIKTDHQNALKLLDKLGQTVRGRKLRRSLFTKLHQELTAHMKAEEQVVYEKISRLPEMKITASVHFVEHEVVDQLLEKMRRTDYESLDWTAECKVLTDLIKTHVKDEEDVLLPEMAKVLSPEELDRLAMEFASAKQGLIGRLASLFAA